MGRLYAIFLIACVPLQARFRQNGGCGYVLKPPLLLGVLEKHLKWGGFKKHPNNQKLAKVSDAPIGLPAAVAPSRRGSVDASASPLTRIGPAPSIQPSTSPLMDLFSPLKAAVTPERGTAMYDDASPAVTAEAVVPAARMHVRFEGDHESDSVDDDNDTVTTGGTSSVAGSGSVASSSITSGEFVGVGVITPVPQYDLVGVTEVLFCLL